MQAIARAMPRLVHLKNMTPQFLCFSCSYVLNSCVPNTALPFFLPFIFIHTCNHYMYPRNYDRISWRHLLHGINLCKTNTTKTLVKRLQLDRSNDIATRSLSRCRSSMSSPSKKRKSWTMSVFDLGDPPSQIISLPIWHVEVRGNNFTTGSSLEH
jgi:hypothetical protein